MSLLLIEIPDWAEGHNLYLFAGQELIGRRFVGLKWQTKVTRCNFCGECCKDVPESWLMGRNEDGSCQHLRREDNKFECDLGMFRPMHCSYGEPNRSLTKTYDWCSSRFREIRK